MTENETPAPEATDAEWLTLPDTAEFLGVQQRAVRSLLDDRSLVAVRRGERNVRCVPRAALIGVGESVGATEGPAVLPNLRGTLIQLADSGFDDVEAADWLLRENDELGAPPIVALREQRTHAVRRAVQALAF